MEARFPRIFRSLVFDEGTAVPDESFASAATGAVTGRLSLPSALSDVNLLPAEDASCRLWLDSDWRERSNARLERVGSVFVRFRDSTLAVVVGAVVGRMLAGMPPWPAPCEKRGLDLWLFRCCRCSSSTWENHGTAPKLQAGTEADMSLRRLDVAFASAASFRALSACALC